MASGEGDKSEGKARKEQELQLTQRFIAVFQRRLDLLRTTMDTDSFKLEPAERKILLEINNFGLMEGVIAGGMTLFVLRRLRSNFLRRIQQQRNMQAAKQQTYEIPK